MDIKSNFESLDGESRLSPQLKDLTNLAKKAQQNHIIEVFYKKNTNLPFQCIPITQQEENELKMTCREILKKIEQLLNQMSDSTNLKYNTIVSKKKDELVEILNELENLQKENILSHNLRNNYAEKLSMHIISLSLLLFIKKSLQFLSPHHLITKLTELCRG